MEIEKLTVGQLGANCYLAWDKKTQKAVIIDPGDAADYLVNRINDLKLKPELIIASHGHFDHLLAVNPLKICFQIPFCLHRNDQFLAERMNRSAQYFLGKNLDFGIPPTVDRFIKQGDLIKFGGEKLKVIETPGHSPGGVAFYDRGILFSGDTLFKQGVGRTDFSYASKRDLKSSIERLLKLPPETVVYPGHGEKTTLQKEGKILQKMLI